MYYLQLATACLLISVSKLSLFLPHICVSSEFLLWAVPPPHPPAGYLTKLSLAIASLANFSPIKLILTKLSPKQLSLAKLSLTTGLRITKLNSQSSIAQNSVF